MSFVEPSDEVALILSGYVRAMLNGSNPFNRHYGIVDKVYGGPDPAFWLADVLWEDGVIRTHYRNELVSVDIYKNA